MGKKKNSQNKKFVNATDKVISLSIIGITVAVVLSMIIYIGANALLDKGYFARKRISVTSQAYSIDNAKLSYFFYEEYRDFVNTKYDELTDLEVSRNKSIKKQKCPYGDYTWYDYFMNLATDNVTKLISLAQAAEESGISLDSADKKEIDFIIEELKTSAKNSEQSDTEYYAFLYGRGVNEEDIRYCLELETLADKYKESLKTDFKLSDDEYEKLYNENEAEYSVADVIKYTFKYPENAENINTYEDFKAAMTVDIIRDYKENYDTEITEEFVELFFTQNSKGTYRLGDDEAVDKHIFLKGTQADTVFSSETDGAITYYSLVGEKYREDYVTKNIRLIYFKNSTYGGEYYAEQYASSIYEKLKEADMSLSRFSYYAKKHSEDTKSSLNGGLYENLLKTTLTDSSVTNWAYSENRKAGDCAIVQSEEGFYILYFESNGQNVWQAAVKSEAFQKYLDELYKSLIEKYDVKINEKYLNKISA